MKVTKEVNGEFVPVTLTIILETKEEYEALLKLMGRDTSIPASLCIEGSFEQSTLHRIMGDIWDAL